MDNIARIDRDRYFLLKKGLKKIDPTKNDWEVLFDMELECVVYSDDYDINNLEPLCRNEDDFKCVCGQAHLKHLAIIRYINGKLYTLGSVCVGELETIMELEEQDSGIREKLKRWIDYIKAYNERRKNRPCIVCNSRTIKKDYDYKDNRRKYRCLSCIEKYYVKCMDCKDYFPHKKTDPFHKSRCVPCYYQHNNQLVFLSDSDSGCD